MFASVAGVGLLTAGFLVGALASCGGVLTKAWGERNGLNADDARRRVRRAFLYPAVFVLPVAGWLADVWGVKDVALIGLIVVALGMFLLSLSNDVRTASTNLIGLSIGTSFLAVGSIAWMPALLGEPNRAVGALNLGFVAVGLGWLAAPTLVERAMPIVDWKRVLRIGSAIAAVALALLSGAEESNIAGTTDVIFGDLRFWLLGLAVLLYLPVEGSLETWSRPFLRDLGDSRTVHSRVFIFWCAYLGARLASFALVGVGFEPWFLLVCAGVSAVTLGNLVGAYASSSGKVGYWIVGFCYGPLLPGLLGLYAQMFPNHFGMVLGILLAGGVLYQATLGRLIGVYARGSTPREAMRVPMVLTLMLTAPLLFVMLMK